MTGRAPNPWIKVVYAAGWLGTWVFAVIGVGLEEGVRGDVGELGGILFRVLMFPSIIAWFGSALWWLWDAWTCVPEAYREAPIVGRMQPALAVALFFIPCFNIVWIFCCNLGLASSTNRALEAQGAPERIPMGLVGAACVLGAIPSCNLLLGPLLWLPMMVVCDRARAGLGRVDAVAMAKVF